eukprot:CAMPEP_0174936546 /NCGR_PEP_ID=MMETSP1355-20121228/57776_1 /TAXON_ID=464990 /ORGANISM="Hemiselmis tepida, Strain CCMP443" /LENGTH=124 /DNA_ID=CAMNT_0016183329 /DNA_START=12 /DNA_END=386 /DNA_ORIENTATION=+
MMVVYSSAGLLLGLRYYQHARYKAKQKTTLAAGGLRAAITQAGQAAGVQILVVGVAVSIPVVFTLIGSVVGFFMGMSIGALLAGILLYIQVTVTLEMEVAIGLCISLMLLCFSAAPSNVLITFL